MLRVIKDIMKKKGLTFGMHLIMLRINSIEIMPVQSRDYGSILWNHYLWCLGEGRDTSWWHRDQASSIRQQASSIRHQAVPGNKHTVQGPGTRHQALCHGQQAPRSSVLPVASRAPGALQTPQDVVRTRLVTPRRTTSRHRRPFSA